jgi:hypothetical protein
MTGIQKITLFLLLAYGIWEIIVWQQSKNQQGAVIRVDLLVIYPVLFILIIISLVQYFWKKNPHK